MSQPTSALPKISIITPSLNQGQFLEHCLQSILSQRYENLEMIVIDGGSTDETLEIIQKYAAHLAYWVSEPDAGQSDAINKGFRHATGDLVTWLNADDYYLDNCLQTVASAYQQHPEASFIFGDGLRVDEKGMKKSVFWEGQQPVFDRQALIFGLNYILQPASFINHSYLKNIGYLNQDLHYGMDTDLWVRLSGIAQPLAIPEVLAASREYGETKTSSGSFARIEELRRIAEKYSDLPLTPGVLCYYLDTLHRLAESHPEHYPESFRRDLLIFWEKSSALLNQYHAQPNGLPIGKPGQPANTAGKIHSMQRWPINLRFWLRRFRR